MERKLIAKNPTARHNYTIEDTIEAGIVLTGTEIKSIRNGKVNIKDTYVNIKNFEAYIYGMHIPPYEKGNIFNKDPMRTRKLLLHSSEIRKLMGKLTEQGYTIMPLQVYLRGSRCKVEIGLAKGKKLYDKRDTIAKKDARREAERDYKVSLRV